MGEHCCPEIYYSAPLGFHKRSLFHFLLNNFAHTRLLCGFDNDKIATGSRRWRGKRVGHGGNFNEIAACSQSQKHRWEFPLRCWHIRSVHPRHHPWAHCISNASLYSRACSAACGWCEDGQRVFTFSASGARCMKAWWLTSYSGCLCIKLFEMSVKGKTKKKQKWK